MKRCSKCGETKPVDKFSSNAARHDGIQTYCQKCTREYMQGQGYSRKRYAADPEGNKAANRSWYEKNPLRWREHDFKTKYNISLEQYQEMLEAQGGVCAICKKPQGARNGKPRWLAVDHDHECCPQRGRSCGKCIRGLLCTSCNTVLGKLEGSDLSWLVAVLEYLRINRGKSLSSEI